MKVIEKPNEVFSTLFAAYPLLQECEQEIWSAYTIIKNSFIAGGKLLACGNGGSAADSEHVVGELMKSFRIARPTTSGFRDKYRKSNLEDSPDWIEGALPAISLVSQTSLMTAFSNDRSMQGVFAQQVYGYGKEGDVLLAISTSGNSANVIEAAKVAKALDMMVIGLTGKRESALRELSDCCICVPETETYRVQELHLPVYHAICAALEAAFFGIDGADEESMPREAIILAGGQGTRLSSVVSDVPKPLARIAGQPFLYFLLNKLQEEGIERVILAVGYKADLIEDEIGREYRGMRIEYSVEETPLLTGGALKQALGMLEGSTAFVLNGDTYSTFNLQEFWKNASPLSEIAVAVIRSDDCTRYGVLELGSDDSVSRFLPPGSKQAGLINSGTYIVRKNALGKAPRIFSFEEHLSNLQGRDNLSGIVVDGEFIDIGVPEDYERAQTWMLPYLDSWRLVLFDRDGTINVDTGHLFKPNELKLNEEICRLIARYNKQPYTKVVVVTNQAGIAKGLYSASQMRTLHLALNEKLGAEFGAHIDAFYHCPHHPEYTGECGCRKPKAGMLVKALSDFNASAEKCVMYGDSEKDAKAADTAHVRFVEVLDGRVEASRDS